VALVVLGIFLTGVLPVGNALWMRMLGIQGVVNVGILSPTPGTGCTYSQGYWKNHPDAWPVEEITIGGVTYPKMEAIAILEISPEGDATYILAHQLIAAKLNIANGADPSAVADTINAADRWLVAHPLESDPRDLARAEGIAMAETLTEYNEGAIGPRRCDDPADPLEILGVVSPTATPTATSTTAATDTATSTPTATATNTSVPAATATPTPTATPSPDPAPEDSPTPTETEFPTPTESPTPTETETPSG
jgi:cell division septation protein DedD